MRVATLGDSLAYGSGDETRKGIAGRLRGHDTVNLGVSGAETSDLQMRMRQERVRREIANADAIVLSIGANDLFRSPHARDETLRNPMRVANQILDRIESIVREIHSINARARILILGGYNPVPRHLLAFMIDSYLGVWDKTLASRFEDDDRVSVVKVSDLVTPQRLSRYDNFHPGGDAYEAIAKRIALMLRPD